MAVAHAVDEVAQRPAQNEAQAALSDAGKAEREAEIQRAIDDGVGYFAARGAADRERLVA